MIGLTSLSLCSFINKPYARPSFEVRNRVLFSSRLSLIKREYEYIEITLIWWIFCKLILTRYFGVGVKPG